MAHGDDQVTKTGGADPHEPVAGRGRCVRFHPTLPPGLYPLRLSRLVKHRRFIGTVELYILHSQPGLYFGHCASATCHVSGAS